MDIYSVALSGMKAAQALMNTAANNISNSSDPNFKAKETILSDVSGGGVQIAGSREIPTNDLATQLANLKQAAFLYKANAAVIRAAATITGSLLDIMDQDRENKEKQEE
jgi:flagellar hook protein FlgE